MKKFILFLISIYIGNFLYAQSDIYDVIPDAASCTAGVLKDSEKQLILAKVNSIRALHGLKPVTYNYSKDINVQKSALITVANENLSHQPSSTWNCYSPEGAVGSANSNLFIKWYYGSALPKSEESITGWMMDQNVDVCGHRRWIIDPFLKFIAFGRAEGPSKSNPQFNVHGASIYVIDNDKQNITDWADDFVAYPFHNYPSNLVLDSKNNYWLFSFTAIFDKTDWWNNRNVSFANATLEIKDASNNIIPFTDLSSNNEGYGVPNVFKWKIPSLQKDFIYNVTVKNVDFNGNKKDFSYWFKVTDQAGSPPPAPSLVAPANGAKEIPTNPVLNWNTSGDATSYNVQVARDNSFTQIVANQSNYPMINYSLNALNTNTTYYWRVSGTNIAGDGPWSPVWSFTTKANDGTRPVLTEPKDQATNVSPTTTLKWTAVAGATAYEVILSDVSTFPTAAITMNQANIPATTYTIPKQVLAENTRYWWKVRTNGSLGPGSWSDPFSFWTWIASSADDALSVSALKIIPNPATDIIDIQTDVNSNVIQLYNAGGNLIREIKLNDGRARENISELASGIYYLVIYSDNRVYSRKFSIIR